MSEEELEPRVFISRQAALFLDLVILPTALLMKVKCLVLFTTSLKNCWNKKWVVFFLRFYLFIFRGEEREKGWERNINCGCLSHLLRETGPATQAGALTWKQVGAPLVCRPVLNPLSHTSQGKKWVSSKLYFYSICLPFLINSIYFMLTLLYVSHLPCVPPIASC